MGGKEVISLVLGTMVLGLYIFSGVYVYRHRALYHVAQRSYLLSLCFIGCNLVLFQLLVAQFLLRESLSREGREGTAEALDLLYGFFKFFILITYFLRCIRLSVVFSPGPDSALLGLMRGAFRSEPRLILGALALSLGITGVSFAGIPFLFVNNLLQSKCMCMDSFLLLAFITFSIFAVCIWLSQRVDYKYSFTAEIILVLALYVFILNLELFLPYPRDASQDNAVREWLWYWSVLLLNAAVFAITVLVPLYLSYRYRDQNFIMPTKRCAAELTLFLGELYFKQPFVAFLQHVSQRGLPQLQVNAHQRLYYRHCECYLQVRDRFKLMQRAARQLPRDSASSFYEPDQALQLFESLILPHKQAFPGKLLQELQEGRRKGGIRKESMVRVLHWVMQRISVLFNEYKSTKSYRKLLQIVSTYEEVNKNMLDYGMIQ